MKIYIDTLGCPKNFYDSRTAAGILEDSGHILTSEPSEADVIMVNTCGFINDAKKESIDRIFEMADYKQYGKKLIVSGCLSQRYSSELFNEMPEVDAFLGVNDYEALPGLLDSLDERRIVANPCTETELPQVSVRADGSMYSATLKIAEGCNNRCAYCIIPFIRGNYRSKRQEAVIAEAKALAEAGCRELILIAQDTTYYGYDLYGEYRLPQLLKQLCRIDGIRWIRLMYCYEDRITDELIQTIREDDKICNYLDIPIQHASDNILKAMKRRSTNRSITDKIAKLKEQIPDIHIRTTLITGFPGETEEDFDTLYDFVAEQRFARLGVFAYSQEEGTVAGQMPNQIDEEIKTERADSIMRLQMEISLEENRSKIDTVQEVIVDEIDEDGSYIGRTRYDAPEIDNAVIFTGKQEHKPGDMVMVHIDDAFDYDLAGTEV